MATNRIEEYLEAILAKIADGTDTTVPAPAWRIEEYLAAIYSALSSGGGSGGGVLVVHDVNGTLDKTFKEINDAYKSGVMPVILYNRLFYYLQSPPIEEYFGLSVCAFLLNVDENHNYSISSRYYTAESANDYPVYDP